MPVSLRMCGASVLSVDASFMCVFIIWFGVLSGKLTGGFHCDVKRAQPFESVEPKNTQQMK